LIQVWRLSRANRATTAFTGEGTRLIGSRWTHPGLPAVYTSGSIALAVLESLVHMDIAQAGPHVVIPATIPDGVAIETLDIAPLPENWYATPAPAVLRDFGSDWLKTQRTAVLGSPLRHRQRRTQLHPQSRPSRLCPDYHRDSTTLCLRWPVVVGTLMLTGASNPARELPTVCFT